MNKPKNDLREVIIETANGLFAKFGIKKTTMDDIARAVKKRKSSLYYYFNSKEEIFQAVLEKEICILKDEINKAIKKEESPLNQVRAYALTRTRVIGNLANFYSAIIDDYFDSYAFIEKFRIKYIEDEIKTLTKVLKAGVDKNCFNIEDVEMAASVFITALKGFEYSWGVKIKLDEINKRINTFLDFILNGIIKN